MPSPVVLVLASGRGERFLASGGQGSKLQALLAGRPVIEHTLAAVRASGLPLHVEEAGHPGMGDSIAAGVRATADAAGWLVLPGDLPLVAPASLRAVAEALARASVVVPFHRGTRGHPVAFGAVHGPALQALTGAEGAAAIVRAAQPLKLELEDEGIVTDIDTVADLARAEGVLASRHAFVSLSAGSTVGFAALTFRGFAAPPYTCALRTGTGANPHAGSSTISPRETLTTCACSGSRTSAAASTMPRVCAFSGQASSSQSACGSTSHAREVLPDGHVIAGLTRSP